MLPTINSVTADNQIGRVGNGSTYHCAHELADFIYRVTDWEPFIYFSTRINDPARPGIDFPETYHLTQTDAGTDWARKGTRPRQPADALYHGQSA